MSARTPLYLYRCLDRSGGLLYVDYTDDVTAIGAEVARYRWGRRVSGWTVDPRMFATERAAQRAVREVVEADDPEYVAVTLPWMWKLAGAVAAWLALFGGVWWAVAGRVSAGDGALLGAVVASTVVVAALVRVARR